jgi:hypothetical protein
MSLRHQGNIAIEGFFPYFLITYTFFFQTPFDMVSVTTPVIQTGKKGMLVLLIWQLIRSFSIDIVLHLSIFVQFIDRYLTLLSFKMYLYPNMFYEGRL